MSDYDYRKSNPMNLIKGRLGIYDKHQFNPSKLDSSLQGVEQQYIRFQQHGGNLQQERMIKDKRRTLDHAVWFSYQAAEVLPIDKQLEKPIRALINPNKLKQDYDDKIISVGFEYGIAPGSVFEWVGTGTHWLVYLQDLTELAYFRGDIRKCAYKISWLDQEKNQQFTYAAIRGPVETKINFIQKAGISVENPNHSLNILMPKTKETLDYFQRYTEFYISQDDEVNQTCWRVEGVDFISTPGILEITAVEYYSNEHEDDLEQGIVGSLIVEPEEDPIEENSIVGEKFIKPKKTYEYEFNGDDVLEWHVDEKYPIILILNERDPKKISIKWLDSFSGQFDLYYGDYKKTIVVESLF